ncbi:MAG: hypothetical protein ACI9U2_001658 [Bradymonadia bacterium]|jgi:hypothetical protein
MMRMMLMVWLVLAGLGCDDPASAPNQPAPAATALRLAFPGDVDGVVCNGRALSCLSGARTGGLCLIDLDPRAQSWPDAVVLCQGVQAEPLFAPVIPVVFKDGLPIWTPNLDADGQVMANAESTALGMAFLSPYLTATWPETARAVLGQTQASPYFDDLVTAVSAKDLEGGARALPPLAADVISQASLTQTSLTQSQQALSDSERSFGMDNIKVERTSGYITMDSRLGTSVDHVCVLYALNECDVQSEVDLAAVGGADTFTKAKLGQTFVPAKSVFNLQVLARTALRELFGDLIPSADLETFRLEPGRVHDIQCYSGSLGLLDEADARADQILIDAEPDGRYFVNYARVANLISVALDTLRLFVDFDAFEDQSDIAKSVATCAQASLGPALAVADGTTREAWFDLLKTVQTCAIKRLGVVLAKRGLHAVALWVFDFALGGGGGWVGKVSRAGMILDRVVGMTLTMSPVQRLLLAQSVDFDACAPCVDECDADVCTADLQLRSCVQVDDCTVLREAPTPCGDGLACDADVGACVACGGLGQVCCPDAICDGGLGCDDGECASGCREECPANGITRCASRGAMQICAEHDGDPCLEWGAAEDCSVGEACEGDACGPPSCEDECRFPDALRCAEFGDAIEVCGQCDDDGCTDWCPEAECDAGLECTDEAIAECVCAEDSPDLPNAHPGQVLGDLTDDGVSHVESNSLWPARDVDMISAYVQDTIRGTLVPTIAVTGAAPDLVYDVCIAFACDPEVNSGEPSSVSCDEGVRTTRDGAPACCVLSQSGDVTVDIDINCTLGGFRDDSGTATAYVEAVDGSQCAPPLRLTLTGGRD